MQKKPGNNVSDFKLVQGEFIEKLSCLQNITLCYVSKKQRRAVVWGEYSNSWNAVVENCQLNEKQLWSINGKKLWSRVRSVIPTIFIKKSMKRNYCWYSIKIKILPCNIPATTVRTQWGKRRRVAISFPFMLLTILFSKCNLFCFYT